LHETFNTKAGIQVAVNSTPFKPGGTPDDVTGAVLYFVSELGSFITRENLEINGGLEFRGHPLDYWLFSPKRLKPGSSAIFCPLLTAWLTVGWAKFSRLASPTVVIPSLRVAQ
jgi:hypothetical protein